MMNSDRSLPMLIAGCLALASLAAAQQVDLKRVPLSQVARLEKSVDLKILPPEAKVLFVDRKQVFSLVGIGSSSITFMPMVFETPINDHGGHARNCGIYILSGTEPAFAFTLDTSENVGACDGLDALGTMPNEGTHPRILLLYLVSTPHVPFHKPVVLKWDDVTSTYVLDAADTDDLQSLNADLTTIAAMRGELHPTPQAHKPEQGPHP